MGLNVTPEEQEKFRELNRLRMKSYRDKTRQRKYTSRAKKLDCSVQKEDAIPNKQGNRNDE